MDPDRQSDHDPDGGVAGAGWGGGACDVVAGLDLIDRGIELVLGASLVTLSVAAAHALDPTGAGYDLALLEDCDDPDRTDPTPGTGPDAGSDAGAGTGTAAGCGTGSEGLPRMGAALAAGLVSRAHVDVAVRCLARVPQHLANGVDEDGVTAGPGSTGS